MTKLTANQVTSRTEKIIELEKELSETKYQLFSELANQLRILTPKNCKKILREFFYDLEGKLETLHKRAIMELSPEDILCRANSFKIREEFVSDLGCATLQEARAAMTELQTAWQEFIGMDFSDESHRFEVFYWLKVKNK